MVDLLTNSVTLSGICMVLEDLSGTIGNSFRIIAAALACRAFVPTSFAFAIFPTSLSVAMKMEEITNIPNCWISSNTLKNIG